MLFFLFVIAFVSCACVLVPLACLGIGLVLRQNRRDVNGGRGSSASAGRT